MGSIPGRGTKIPHAMQRGQKKEKKKSRTLKNSGYTHLHTLPNLSWLKTLRLGRRVSGEQGWAGVSCSLPLPLSSLSVSRGRLGRHSATTHSIDLGNLRVEESYVSSPSVTEGRDMFHRPLPTPHPGGGRVDGWVGQVEWETWGTTKG